MNVQFVATKGNEWVPELFVTIVNWQSICILKRKTGGACDVMLNVIFKEKFVSVFWDRESCQCSLGEVHGKCKNM